MPYLFGIEYVIRGGAFRRVGRTVTAPVDPGTPEPFILGTTEPTWSNTGTVASGRPVPTRETSTVVTGNVTIPANTTVYDTIYDGIVTLSSGVRMVNCIFTGAAVWSGNSYVIKCDFVGGTRARLEFCDIKPRVPSAYATGMGPKNYYAYRCLVDNCTDGFAAFSTTSDGICNILIEGCFVPRMVRWAPDYANKSTTYPDGRPESHNDCCQLQGNLGNENDIVLRGNSFIATYNPNEGNQPVTWVNFAAIMVTPNAQITVSATFDLNWFRRGIATFNASPMEGGGKLVITNNRFERPGTVSPNIAGALLLSTSTISNRVVSGNTYIDNKAAVPIINGT